ncbi:aldose 1-epimerase [Lentzea albidocapillata subsp. violacea]|uniref:Aldose 1-epimerase n=1 Tax=Lentzea albidocapillata subsp. violacea TaxID=128104 RepID=A0A1G8Q0P8_9PSEU|nr:aldose epimerase family protein [Lentzea albidocapillata]SDI97670.1 aldose 1-epimerase [Lentzea albidocapillata subsp. violacea]
MSQREPELRRELFGRAGDTDVHRYVLAWPGGLTVRVLDYGGVIQSLEVPDRHGVPANVVLGFPALDDYLANNRPGAARVFFGAVIGRYANRIARGAFTLDDVQHQLPLNNGPNSLHGGPAGFDTRVWSATELHETDSVGVQLELVSPHGDGGFPGTVDAQVTYRLDRHNRLSITYRATADAPTVLNMTNHTYWNLAGEGSGDVHRQSLMLNASRFCAVDENLIPVGAPVPVEASPFDFRLPTAIGARIRAAHPQLRIAGGYDHNWVLDSSGASFAAQACDPVSGRLLTMWTSEPGLQFYSGNFLTEDLVGTSGRPYGRGAGFALEAQHFPDSPNRQDFPSTVLRPGDVYHQETVFQLSTAD